MQDKDSNELSIEQKLKLISEKEAGQSKTFLMKKYNVGKSSYYKILNKKEEYLSAAYNFENMNKKRTVLSSAGEKLDKAVNDWFDAMRSRNKTVTGLLL